MFHSRFFYPQSDSTSVAVAEPPDALDRLLVDALGDTGPDLVRQAQNHQRPEPTKHHQPTTITEKGGDSNANR